jgi:AcrR family transcriptional regulator
MKEKSTTRRYTQGARAQTAEATANRIVEAFLARLMTQWYDEITLDRVAEDAGVTVQTVVRRFGGKEGLLGSAVKVLGAQIDARRAAPPGDLKRQVDNLVKDYEAVGDGVIRLLALEPRYAVIQEVFDFGRSEHRQWVSTAFAEPLSRLDAKTRERAIDALVIATGVFTWKLLRREMARSVAATSETMRTMIESIISGFSERR